MRYAKPNMFCYRIAQIVAWVISTFIFRRKIIRNEIRGKKGPFVIIANHEAALDFVNIIGCEEYAKYSDGTEYDVNNIINDAKHSNILVVLSEIDISGYFKYFDIAAHSQNRQVIGCL